jgi:hypothetical protein
VAIFCFLFFTATEASANMPVLTRRKQLEINNEKQFSNEVMAMAQSLQTQNINALHVFCQRLGLCTELFRKLNRELIGVFYADKSKWLKFVAAGFVRSYVLDQQVREMIPAGSPLMEQGKVFLELSKQFRAFAEPVIRQYYYLDAHNKFVVHAMQRLGMASAVSAAAAATTNNASSNVVSQALTTLGFPPDAAAEAKSSPVSRKRVVTHNTSPKSKRRTGGSTQTSSQSSRMCTRSMADATATASVSSMEAQTMHPQPLSEDPNDLPFPIETSANAHVTVRRSKRLEAIKA